FFFFSSRRRHTRCLSDWSSDVCSSDLPGLKTGGMTDSFPSGASRNAVEIFKPVRGHDMIGAALAKLLQLAGVIESRECDQPCVRSEERRVGKECRSRWSSVE